MGVVGHTKKSAFDQWQKANIRVNKAEDDVRTARFDFRTAENIFHNFVVTEGPYVDEKENVVYYVSDARLQYVDIAVAKNDIQRTGSVRLGEWTAVLVNGQLEFKKD